MASEDAAWTVLVYMAGDNNLTEDMVWGLQELKKTAARLEARPGLKPEDRINVFAHFDPRGSRSRRYDFVPSVRSAGAARPETTMRTSVPKRASAKAEAAIANGDGNLAEYQAQIHTRKAASNPPAGTGAETAADPSLSNPLATFVSDQIGRLPRAQRYFLVLSGHGSGAVGDFLIDSDPVTSLSIPKLANILRAARTKYKERTKQDKRIDILGMDSCLMSNAEVCCEVSHDADFLVASEGWVANAGWPYHRVLAACLKDDSEADLNPRSVAARVARNYSDFYRDYEIGEMSTDIAVCDLSAFHGAQRGTLMGTLRELSAKLVEAFDTVFAIQQLFRTSADGDDDVYDFVAKLRRKRPTPNRQGQKHVELTKALAAEQLTDSQWRALRDLMRSLTDGKPARASDDDALEALMAKDSSGVIQLLDNPPSLSAALAAVRLRREFDPSVVDELQRIEGLEVNPEPEKQREAMLARIRLQKRHQMLSATDLIELATPLVPPRRNDLREAIQLLNAVVSARWEAQSFKGGVYVDLADFCRCIEARLANGKVKTLCARVRRAIEGSADRKLKGCAFGARHTGSANQHATGLSVYFPYQAGDYTTEYENLSFAKKTGWERLIRSYLRVTRRERKGERTHWRRDNILRFGNSEVDPLEPDGIEARIVGVNSPLADASEGTRKPGKTGGEPKIKTGGEPKIKAGGEGKIRAGGEGKIRAGSEAKIRGEGVRFVWGNPPDGFFRQGAKK